jgi:hypothetical protein
MVPGKLFLFYVLTIYLWLSAGHLPRAKRKVPIAKPNVSPVGEESNMPSDEYDDEDSSEEYDGETKEESEKSTGDVDPDEVENNVSD